MYIIFRFYVDSNTPCIYIMPDTFKWDDAKSEGNLAKHGIAFIDIPVVFSAPMVTFLDLRKEYSEDRWLGIGWLRDILVVVVFTESEDGIIRIISARKATRHEETLYRQEIRD